MKNSSTQKAYDYIRSRIFNREFPPGDFLPALGLSKQIGVSRPTVKEALRHLEQEELVEIQAKTGAFVRVLSMEEFDDLFGLRQSMEVYAVGQAALLHQEPDIVHLRKLLALMKERTEKLLEDSDDLDSYLKLGEYDMHLHQSIIEICRNKMIQKRYEQAQIVHALASAAAHPLVPSWRQTLDSLTEVNEEHQQIYDAIVARDKRRAQEMMENHLERMAAKIRLYNLQARQERVMPSPGQRFSL